MSRNLVLLTTLIIVLAGTSGLAFKVQRVEASGTIYIRADGSVDPPDVPISNVKNVLYTFTDNIRYDLDEGRGFAQIVVQRDNIVIDGADHALGCLPGSDGNAITLSGRTNITIKNLEIALQCCVRLDASSKISICGNHMRSGGPAVWLSSSSGNNISGNTMIENWADYSIGIRLVYSSNNTITRNNVIEGPNMGIWLQHSSNNTICENNITDHWRGIWLENSSNNKIYHNNFVNNKEQVYSSYSTNLWDNGYPFGGNYWSDYRERYPNATEIDGSGIWDTPYEINQDNVDHYPIVPEFPSFLILPLFMIVTLLAVIAYRRKHQIRNKKREV